MDAAFKETCIRLRREGKSIGEIARITGRNKSSVYPHIQAIPLSAQRRTEIRAASTERIRKYPLARKGKSVRPCLPFVEWTASRVTLVAHLSFDGELSVRRGCAYHNRSRALIAKVTALFKKVYAYQPATSQNLTTGVFRISYYNVALATYLRGKAMLLHREVLNVPKEWKRAYLKAFFDDEGCMDFRPEEKRRQVRGYQKDVRILRVVQKLLADFGMESRIIAPNEVVVSGRTNLEIFAKEIGFSKGVGVNGRRSNSRWKANVEKCALLRRAIESYRR